MHSRGRDLDRGKTRDFAARGMKYARPREKLLYERERESDERSLIALCLRRIILAVISIRVLGTANSLSLYTRPREPIM